MDLDLELAAIRSGDADAYARWLSHAERPLRESLRSFARYVDTEAMLQEGLLRVWQVAPHVKPDGRPNALLRMAIRICRNACVSDLRRRREVVPAEEGMPAEGSYEPQPPDPMLRQRILLCLERLPGKPREVLMARLQSFGDADDVGIATRLSMKLNTFLQNFTRARNALEECLRRAGVEV